MLHLVFGRAGSGKTKFAREYFKENYSPDKKQILIVPEQYSFETEKAVLDIMGEEKASHISVMSFSRLCEWFFRIYGGAAGVRLTDGGRAVLMQLAIDSAADSIEIYKDGAQKGELIELLLSMLSEMKMCGISPEEMISFAESTGDSQLSSKAREISAILSSYEALVGRSYIDPLDDLTNMDNMLENCDFFSGSTVVIDSFSGFTAQEMRIISRMLKASDDVYITLCADSLKADNQTALFSVVQKTAAKLLSKAKENFVKIAPPVYLEPGLRYKNKELKALEKYIFSWEYEKYAEEPENIEVYEARDIYDESEYVSAKIRELVMQENYRYGDIAVISRDPDKYINVLNVALKERDIAYFMDKPEDIVRKPIVKFVLSALEIVSGGYQSIDIFQYIKTGIAGISSYETSLLENYTYIWKISGRKWLSDWRENPNGFGAAANKQSEAELLKINALRRKIIAPLVNFENAVSEGSAKAVALGIYNLLCEAEAQKHIQELCEKFDLLGETQRAARQMRLWDTVMAVLDQIVSVMGDTKADLTEFLRLFKLNFSTVSISDIPKGVDEVTVGAADRIRPAKPRAVFIIGAVRGEFPKVPQNASLFSLDERKKLIEAGMPIGRSFEESSAEEMLIAYLASCSSSEKVFFSYAKGDGAYPSEMISKALKIFPRLTVKSKETYADTFFADTLQSAFRLAAKLWSENSGKANALKKIFEGKEEFKGKIEALNHALSKEPVKLCDSASAMSLFGSGRRLSATQIETYHLCRFRYFCQYALRAKKLEPASLSALEYGSLMHYLFEKIFFSYSAKEIISMSEEELRGKIAALSKEYSKINYESYDETSKRFSALLSRLADSAYFLISHIALELSQSKFSPQSFELEVGGQELPMNIPMPDGRTVSVAGKIDRVDTYTENGETYVRVVDYKTGKKEFAFSDVLYGLNLQMFIYLAALVENKKGIPAGVLYMPSQTITVSKQREIPQEKLEEEIQGSLKMNGVVLNDEKIISAMEEKCEGRFIPVGIGKNGKMSGAEYLVSREEFDIISKTVKNKITSMAKTLQSGDIDALPLMNNKFGCSYCPYFPVCKKEFSEDSLNKSKLKHEDVFRILGGGEENER